MYCPHPAFVLSRIRRLVAAGIGLLAVAVAFGSEAAQPAAGPPTGTVAGRVQNVVTGQYLNNVRVTVRGTGLSAFTDESGTYRLAHVPGGTAVLEFFYTGLDPQQITVQVPRGGVVEQNVDLTSVARYGQPSELIKLDSFVVASSRETDAESIAINEQRFAPNIKNVVAADALGDLMDGNVGEFLKFMPGITAEYDTESGGSVASISVRGFPTSMAVVSSDGSQLANTGNPQGSSRVFQFGQVSINNISRLEVTKVPAPSSPADSMAGSVNMVTKSAFERKDAQLRYSMSLSANHESVEPGRQVHTSDRKIHKILPSASFDYTLPVSRNFGLVATGTSMNRFTQQHISRRVYNSGGTATGASFDRPFLQTYRFQTAPRVNNRHSLGLRADWRVTPSGVLSVNVEASRFESDRVPLEIQFNAGTNANPTPASGVAMSFGDDYTIGATGRGAVTMLGAAAVKQTLTTKAANARYRFDNGDWRVEAGAGRSVSEGGYQDTKHGRFRQLGIAMMNPVRVAFADVNHHRPQSILVYDNNNREVDWYNLANYRLNTANSTPRDIKDQMTTGRLDVRKTIPALPFPAAVQAGGAHRGQTRDVRRQNINWTYNGPDGNPATPDSPAPYAATRYVNQYDRFGFSSMPWVSSFKVWEAFQANPNLFSKTPAQVVTEETFRINNSELLKEEVNAVYLQGEAGLLRNRLKVLTGVRFEKTTTQGVGPLFDPAAVWVRTASGGFARTPAGARIRRPEAGAVGSMEELRLTRQERAVHSRRSYDGYYPSVHFTYQIRENLLARAAYAKTYGRPDFSNIIPNASVDEADLDDDTADPTLLRGRLNVRNTGLRPWTADNYDLSLEFYTDQGGLFSAGVFMKDIDNFFGNDVRVATLQDLQELDLDPRYVGWELRTQYNLPGTARVKGAEFNLRHSLRPLGGWGRHFQGFVNGTKLRLEGSQDANFSGFIPESANWGLTFSRKPVNVMAKWNYRGKQRRNRVTGVDGFEYQRARITLDMNVEYQLRRNLQLYLSGQNVLNKYDTWQRYGPQTPDYAKNYEIVGHGVQIMLGVKGTF
jgi:iron complex outermembrane recepter protein